jgi:hypothetical protein
LTKQEQNELNNLIDTYTPPIWDSLPGPQTQARESLADITFYGGAAGGGKTDLAIGLTLLDHEKSIIFRKEATQLTGVIDRMTELQGGRNGYNGQEKIWRLPGRQVEFGSMPHIGTEMKYQGRPHDLIVYDEITHFLELQVRFTMGWLRTTRPGQRCRVLFTGNPPTDSNGDWVINFFAPWLDSKHPNPAKHGELRWYAVLDGEDTPVDSGEPFEYNGTIINPQSRTFIPSRVTDNPYLMGTDYVNTLQALPEPLRSQMLYGDFSAGRSDGEWQIIPTKWVDEAMDRWQSKPPCGMESMGVDPARGGNDKMVLAPRHGNWFGELISYPGSEVPDGQTGASIVIKHIKNGAVPLVDLIGWGASCFDHLDTFGVLALAMNGAETRYTRTDISGKLKMRNNRTYWYWKMRDMLDPRNGYDIELPNDPELKADLCALEYSFTASGIQAESKDEVKKRIGRSPDKGDAVVYANGEEVAHLLLEDDDDYGYTTEQGRNSTTGY